VNAIIISSTTSAVTSVDSAAQYAKQQLDRVTQYLQFQGIEPGLRGRITEFYKYMLSAAQSSVEQTRFFQDLPPQLNMLLAIEMNRPLIINCQLFQVLDNEKILLLLAKLIPCTFLPKQVIIRAGQPSRAMYFIIRGLVCKTKFTPKTKFGDNQGRRFSRRLSKRMSIDPGAVGAAGIRRTSILGALRSEAASYKPVMLTDHDFFGDASMQDEKELPTDTCIALTYCNISALSHEDFAQVLGSVKWQPAKKEGGVGRSGSGSSASRASSRLREVVKTTAHVAHCVTHWNGESGCTKRGTSGGDSNGKRCGSSGSFNKNQMDTAISALSALEGAGAASVERSHPRKDPAGSPPSMRERNTLRSEVESTRSSSCESTTPSPSARAGGSRRGGTTEKGTVKGVVTDDADD